MTSIEAAEAIQCGIKEINKDIETVLIPMADGGEGTVEAFCSILKGEEVEVKRLDDPLGRSINATYCWVEETSTAVIETASASGLPLLKEGELNPDIASTYGTGQLITSALDKGARKIILGLGGSATVDAGTGCFQALGVKFRDKDGVEVQGNGGVLAHIASIDLSEMDSRLNEVEFIIASDVTNPLLGSEGAITIFGPQKGVRDIDRFEAGMENYKNIVSEHVGKNVDKYEGSGAAGGFGFSLLSFLNPRLVSGFTLIAELCCLEAEIKTSDLVITGEGRVDEQTLYGKVPAGLARLAKQYNVPVVAFAGTTTMIHAKELGLKAVLPIIDEPMVLHRAIERGPELLYKACMRFMIVYQWLSEKKD
ncbi:glycerate kinase [Pseudalkalibacillus hwajinpoensis]|uniref:Glycerate kinase n=2 Tax=Guptibacillus hwajinpoensis TaxID=208199 RepID=A0A4U1MJ68_9BACL|nr:glycerate kinase [Pseudalkalibacillus hwajinpoensis]